MSDTGKIIEAKMKKTIESFRKSLAGIRTGRASASLLDTIIVEYYGTQVPLKQLAGVSAPEPRLLVVTPYDKTAVQSIEKAIQTSDLGLQPMADGGVIRLPIPQLTEERRKDLVKHVKKEGEDFKVALRNLRQDAMKDVKKGVDDKTITEDQKKNKEEEIQVIINKYSKEIDTLLAAKEIEIMEV